MKLKHKFYIIFLLITSYLFSNFHMVGAKNVNSMIDISSYQEVLTVADFKEFMRYGVTAVVIKATEGTQYINPYLNIQTKNAYLAGLSVNFYHYARYSSVSEAAGEALFFAKTVENVANSKKGMMVNDQESAEIERQSLEDNIAANAAFVRELKLQGFIQTDTYTMSSWLNYVTALYGGQKGWIANFSNIEPPNVNAWQWSSNKTFPEIYGKVFDISYLYNDAYLQGKESTLKTKPKSKKQLIDKKYFFTPTFNNFTCVFKHLD